MSWAIAQRWWLCGVWRGRLFMGRMYKGLERPRMAHINSWMRTSRHQTTSNNDVFNIYDKQTYKTLGFWGFYCMNLAWVIGCGTFGLVWPILACLNKHPWLPSSIRPIWYQEGNKTCLNKWRRGYPLYQIFYKMDMSLTSVGRWAQNEHSVFWWATLHKISVR